MVRIGEGEDYHHKYQSPVTPPEAHAPYKMNPVKSSDNKSIKDCLAVRHQHHEQNNTILFIDNQKNLAEKHNDQQVAITLLIVGTGLIAYHFSKRNMAGILLTIFEAVIDALVFVGTNCEFSKTGLCNTEAECNRHDLAEEKFQKAKDKWNKDRTKQLNFINQRLRQKMKLRHPLAMLMNQWLSSVKYLENEQNPYLLNLSYQIFIIHQRLKIMVKHLF